MKEESTGKKLRKGKEFIVTRNFIGTLTKEDFIIRVAKAYIEREKAYD